MTASTPRRFFLLLVAVSACGGAPGTSALPNDASRVDDAADVVDGAGGDATTKPWGVAPALRVQPTFNGTEANPNLGCAGTRAPLPDGADGATFGARVRDFQLEAVVPSQRMNVYFGAFTPGACAAPSCYAVTTNAMGQVMLRGEAGRPLTIEMVAARRGENDALNPTHAVAFDILAAAPGGRVELASISESTRRYMPQSAGLGVTAGTAQVMGVARDCDGAPLKNATVRVFDAAGAEVPLGAQGPGAAYTNVVHRPDRAQRATSFNGQFLVVNLSPAAAPFRIEAWGVIDGSATPRRVACEIVRTWADTVSLRDLRPLRRAASDDPCGASARSEP